MVPNRVLDGQLKIRTSKARVRWLKILAATKGTTMQLLVEEALDLLDAANKGTSA